MPKIKINIFSEFSADMERQRIDEEINKRIAYLDSEFDIPENRIHYEKTKCLLLQTLKSLSFICYPFIGVDDEGQVIAEWHDYEDFSILTIEPKSEEQIIFRGIQKNGAAVVVSTNLTNLEHIS